jgi:hypothetical protein
VGCALPAGHAVHVEADAAPRAAECLPAGHEYAQVVHAAQPASSAQMHLKSKVPQEVLSPCVLKYR